MESNHPPVDKQQSLPHTPMITLLQPANGTQYRSMMMTPRKLALIAGTITGLFLLQLLNSSLGHHSVSDELFVSQSIVR